MPWVKNAVYLGWTRHLTLLNCPSLKSIYHHRKIDSSNQKKHTALCSPLLNSKDGIEEPLDEGHPSFHLDILAIITQNTFCPIGIGLAIASPTLALKEGRRLVKLFRYLQNIVAFPLATALNHIAVYATGKRVDWLPIPFRIHRNRVFQCNQ